MIRNRILPLAVWLAVGLGLAGCATPRYQQPPPLTQEDVIAMARAGKTDPEIVQEIKTRRTYYRLSAQDIVHLHDSGVSYPVINAMLETYLQAVRDEQHRYDAGYYWYPYYGYWYYYPPPPVIIKGR